MSALEQLFSEALDLPSAHRAAFVAERCGHDPALRDRLEALLGAHESTARGFLVQPALEALAEPLEPGAKFGRYEVLHQLGQGGMGVVYAAYDAQLDRRVALKLVREDRAVPDARARLELEARALAKLQHPNVVAVHDVGEHGPQLFIAMELIDGQPLSAWAQNRSWREVLRVLIDAGRGLAEAHRAGILHRDFKPANVLIDQTGRARVADFGLAARPHHALADSGNGLTEPGAPMGTPGYMAPELFQRKPASVASDVYAFSRALQLLLHELPGLPDWVAPLWERGLAVQSEARWPNVDSLLLALENELGADPLHDPRPARAQRRWVYLVFAVMTVGIPAAVLGGEAPLRSTREAFLLSLGTAVAVCAAVAAFWSRLSRSPYTLRLVKSLLVLVLAMVANRAIAMRLELPLPAIFTTELLIFASVFAALAAFSQKWFGVGAAVSAMGCAAIAVFPAHCLSIFTVSTVALLPIGYEYWAGRKTVSGG